MKSMIMMLGFFVMPSFANAGIAIVNYKTIKCQLLVDDKVVTEKSDSLMTLVIEDHLGRFAQIQFGDETKKIQYQVLIEDDVNSKTEGSVIVLQNLLVDTLESSSEFSAKEIPWVKITQGNHKVTCDFGAEVKEAAVEAPAKEISAPQ